MKRIAHSVVWLDDMVLKINLAACGALLTVMVSVAALGVIFRFILHSSLSWSEELDAYLFVWLTCLGAAAGVKMRSHPEVRALADRLPGALHKLVADLTDVAVLTLGLIFVVYGSDMIAMMGTETAASLPISMDYPYLAIPVGGALLAWHSVARLLISHLAPGLEYRVSGIAPGMQEHL